MQYPREDPARNDYTAPVVEKDQPIILYKYTSRDNIPMKNQ